MSLDFQHDIPWDQHTARELIGRNLGRYMWPAMLTDELSTLADLV